MSEAGKFLVVAGTIVTVVGLLLIFGERLGLGRLPGDIVIERIGRKNFTLYFPIVTCLILSAILTLILWFINGRR